MFYCTRRRANGKKTSKAVLTTTVNSNSYLSFRRKEYSITFLHLEEQTDVFLLGYSELAAQMTFTLRGRCMSGCTVG